MVIKQESIVVFKFFYLLFCQNLYMFSFILIIGLVIWDFWYFIKQELVF